MFNTFLVYIRAWSILVHVPCISPYYVEGEYLASLSYNCNWASRIWYIIPPCIWEAFKKQLALRYFLWIMPEMKTTFFNPALLHRSKTSIKDTLIVQPQGHFVKLALCCIKCGKIHEGLHYYWTPISLSVSKNKEVERHSSNAFSRLNILSRKCRWNRFEFEIW